MKHQPSFFLSHSLSVPASLFVFQSQQHRHSSARLATETSSLSFWRPTLSWERKSRFASNIAVAEVGLLVDSSTCCLFFDLRVIHRKPRRSQILIHLIVPCHSHFVPSRLRSLFPKFAGFSLRPQRLWKAHRGDWQGGSGRHGQFRGHDYAGGAALAFQTYGRTRTRHVVGRTGGHLRIARRVFGRKY